MQKYRSLVILFISIVAASCENLKIATTQLGIPIEVPPSNGGIQIFNLLYPPQFSATSAKPEATAPSCHCATDHWYLIRNPISGMVLEPNSDNEVVIEYITRSDNQLWKFEPVGPPSWYYIVNKQTGDVLDVMGYPNKVITRRKSDSETQQWSVQPNGRIYNKGRSGNIDIKNGNYQAENDVQLIGNNGNAEQDFSLNMEDIKSDSENFRTQKTLRVISTNTGHAAQEFSLHKAEAKAEVIEDEVEEGSGEEIDEYNGKPVAFDRFDSRFVRFG